ATAAATAAEVAALPDAAAGGPWPRPARRAAFVDVALDLPVDRLFTYAVPEPLRTRAAVGRRVHVRFRGRKAIGFIAAVRATCELAKVLPLAGIPDEPALLTADLLELATFVARYYGCSLGEAFAAMVPRGVRGRGEQAGRVVLRLAPVAAGQPAPRIASGPRERVLRLLAAHPEGLPAAEVLREAKVSRGPVMALVKAGQLLSSRELAPADDLEQAAASPPAEEDRVPPPLMPGQQAALEAVEQALASGTFAPFLLLGITGSGKTEVYLRAIAATVARGRQAVVLVPEIALTPQTVRRFRARFERVAVLHSGQSEAERARAWRRIHAGEADVVIGPRSAVFAPVPRLGLLVVDEEHETTFKQQNVPRYHARDAGLVRARAVGAAVLLGSATPSLESWRNAQEGRYRLLRLGQRPGARTLPSVQVVSLRSGDERPEARAWLGRTLLLRMREALAARGQVILLQNRRGFATSVACPRCGWVLRCHQCSVGLTYHRHGHRALCHLCAHEREAPSTCPDCALPALRMQGVGTQTVEEEVRSRFPDARVARMDSDSMGRRDAYEDVLGRFGRGEIDVLVGTQMVAKGLHFPAVTLVGIISADTALLLPDFRAAERTFALVEQVAGRAGRGDEDGRVVVQTTLPDHPAIRLAAEHDYEGFAALELADRQAHGYPPWTRLLRVVVRGAREEAVAARAQAAADLLAPLAPPLVLLGPAVPTVARVEGKARRHLLVKAPTAGHIAQALQRLRAAPRPARGVEEQLDVDPVGLL
ncbi:MAG: primosomal protein N', partial [Planctomycetia bacterium]